MYYYHIYLANINVSILSSTILCHSAGLCLPGNMTIQYSSSFYCLPLLNGPLYRHLMLGGCLLELKTTRGVYYVQREISGSARYVWFSVS